MLSIRPVALLWITLTFWVFPVLSQGQDAVPVDVTIEVQADTEAVMEAQEAAQNAAQATPSPDGKPKPEDGKDKKPKDGKDKEDEGPKAVKRTNEPPEKPNPDELKINPDQDGCVQFHFRNQPWPDLLRWLATASNLSLDWQELPGDYLNLATQRPHTLTETRDMLNRHLLLRGFTMLESEGTLSVVKIKDINPAMVPRVDKSELADLPPHSFVRTSFELAWLMASEVHEEFKSMLSPNGKLTPLPATNRLEAMDSAANLLDIANVLDQEQSLQALENLAREFPLEYARASNVKEQLEIFLGIKKPSSSGRGSPDVMQMVQQQMQQMQQQMQQQGGNAQNKKTKATEEVYLVANDRSNSVIVHAPQDKMAIIASFIARIDVPNNNAAGMDRVGIRMKVFRLTSISPAELVATLNSMDVLEPATRLQVDTPNNAIIAYASVADQYLINSVVERLDGSQRSAHVIQLRRLDAEAVAGSIKFLMGADEEQKDNNNDRYRYFYYDYNSSSRQSDKNKDKMRVAANVVDNQVLVWANEIEMEEVQNLLVKLGELPPPGGRASTVRVIDASRQPETYEYLKRLQEQWNRISPNPLELPKEEEFVDPDKPEKNTQPPKKEGLAEPITQLFQNRKAQLISKPDRPDKETKPDNETNKETKSDEQPSTASQSGETQPTQPEKRVSVEASESPTVRANVEKDSPVDAKLEGNTAAKVEPAKVSIMVDEGGNLIIRSDDTAALDRLEEIMQRNKPPRRSYEVFTVRYSRATWVKLNLDEYFEKKKDTSSDPRSRYYSWLFDFDTQDNKKDEGRQLGKKVELRFIADNDTSTIVAIGADDVDRRTIKELIELWDVPEPVNGKDVRYTNLVQVKYSDAEAIVATIKDAYRDLLSANDSAVQQRNNNGNGKNNEEKRNNNGDTVQADGGLSGSFKGELSLGADTVTNSILVSAKGEPLMELICDMIEKLDEAAKPEGNMEVMQISPGMASGSMEKALRALFQKQQKKLPNKPNQNGQANQQQNNENDN